MRGKWIVGPAFCLAAMLAAGDVGAGPSAPVAAGKPGKVVKANAKNSKSGNSGEDAKSEKKTKKQEVPPAKAISLPEPPTPTGSNNGAGSATNAHTSSTVGPADVAELKAEVANLKAQVKNLEARIPATSRAAPPAPVNGQPQASDSPSPLSLASGVTIAAALAAVLAAYFLLKRKSDKRLKKHEGRVNSLGKVTQAAPDENLQKIRNDMALLSSVVETLKLSYRDMSERVRKLDENSKNLKSPPPADDHKQSRSFSTAPTSPTFPQTNGGARGQEQRGSPSSSAWLGQQVAQGPANAPSAPNTRSPLGSDAPYQPIGYAAPVDAAWPPQDTVTAPTVQTPEPVQPTEEEIDTLLRQWVSTARQTKPSNAQESLRQFLQSNGLHNLTVGQPANADPYLLISAQEWPWTVVVLQPLLIVASNTAYIGKLFQYDGENSKPEMIAAARIQGPWGDFHRIQPGRLE
jgi:hypothetical protein